MPSKPMEAAALAWISCGSCGRSFQTVDGPGMIAAIKGPCPDCGGAFELVGAEGQPPK